MAKLVTHGTELNSSSLTSISTCGQLIMLLSIFFIDGLSKDQHENSNTAPGLERGRETDTHTDAHTHSKPDFFSWLPG